MIGVFLALLVLTTLLWVLLKALGVIKTGPDFSDPKATIAFGLAVFNLILWGMVPWFWDVLTYQWYVPILFNLGLGAFLYLRKADGKTLASLVGGALVLGLLTNAYFEYKLGSKIEAGSNNAKQMFQPVASNPRNGILGPPSMDEELLEIAYCESNNQHFDSDGKLVRYTTDKEDSVGRYQINIGDPSIKKLMDDNGLDPTKEGDNRKAAELLYRLYKRAPWKGSEYCWSTKLLAKGYGRATMSLPKQIALVEPEAGKWSAPVYSPLIEGTELRWGRLDKSKGSGCEVMLMFEGKPSVVIPIVSETPKLVPERIQFKCPDEGVQIRVRVRAETVPAVVNE